MPKQVYLETRLKIFRIEDLNGEEYYIVAKSKNEALKYYLKELNFENFNECDLEIREIEKADDCQINLNNDDEFLLNLINKNRNDADKIEIINIWNLLKYNLIVNILQDKAIKIPNVICSSTFN
jgi:hypothetical protein